MPSPQFHSLPAAPRRSRRWRWRYIICGCGSWWRPKSNRISQEDRMRTSLIAPLLLAATLLIPTTAPAQGAPAEIVELRRRITVLRAQMPTITAVGEYVADFFDRDSSARFLASGIRSAPLL